MTASIASSTGGFREPDHQSWHSLVGVRRDETVGRQRGFDLAAAVPAGRIWRRRGAMALPGRWHRPAKSVVARRRRKCTDRSRPRHAPGPVPLRISKPAIVKCRGQPRRSQAVRLHRPFSRRRLRPGGLGGSFSVFHSLQFQTIGIQEEHRVVVVIIFRGRIDDGGTEFLAKERL